MWEKKNNRKTLCFRLDPTLYKACHEEATNYCSAPEHWFETADFKPDMGPQIFACLYRRIKEKNQVSWCWWWVRMFVTPKRQPAFINRWSPDWLMLFAGFGCLCGVGCGRKYSGPQRINAQLCFCVSFLQSSSSSVQKLQGRCQRTLWGVRLAPLHTA